MGTKCLPRPCGGGSRRGPNAVFWDFSSKGLERGMGEVGGIHALRRIAGFLGLIAGGLTGRQLLRQRGRPGRSALRRRLQRARGRAGPAGAERRRRLSRRQALYVSPAASTYPPRTTSYSAVGLASWYGDDFHGRYTANGEIYDMNSITAAHPTLPLPSYARVTNLSNHKSIVVRVNDRGPYRRRPRHRRVGADRKDARLLRQGRHQGESRICRPRAACRLRRRQACRHLARPRHRAGRASEGRLRPMPPTYFDPRPMAPTSPNRPTPPERPYALGEGERAPQPQPRVTRAAPTVELAAATRSTAAPSPVSAYAPVRYDGSAGFMSGRGLY